MQTLKSKIEQAKQELNISTSELSRRMGYSRNYVSNMVSNGCTTKKQQEMISIINSILSGEVIKTDKQVIAELSEKLDESQSNVNRLLDDVRDMIVKAGKIAELNLKLSNDIETCHESLQDRSDKILMLEDEITYMNNLNTLQNDSMSKQQLLNQDLNAENKILKKQRVDDARRYSMIIAVLTIIIIVLGVMYVY